jgi:tRNA 2-thiouridine synthesizing protein B
VILHTINATPASPAFRDCIRLLRKGDALLLLGDGVYAALTATKACAEIKNTGAELYLLEPDADAAGLLKRIDDIVCMVDYQGFVTLTERFTKHQAWY